MLKTSSKEMLGKLGSLIGLVLIVIVITILNPSFMTTDNILNILRQVSISALIAFGMTFVILTGGIDREYTASLSTLHTKLLCIVLAVKISC